MNPIIKLLILIHTGRLAGISLLTAQVLPNEDGILMVNGISLPGDYPIPEVTVNMNPDTLPLYCFYEGSESNFILILDNEGAPFYYRRMNQKCYDFKLQENGLITMSIDNGYGGGSFIALDSSMSLADTPRF